MMINVFSASSQLGRKVVESLLGQGCKPSNIIASVRSPEKVDDMVERGIDVRKADYDDPDLLEQAFAGTDRLLLIPTMAPVEPRIQQHNNALEAAKKAGVKHVFLSSFTAATPKSKFHMAPFILYAESKLRLSGIEWTILRNNMYLEAEAHWLPKLLEMGCVPYPVKHGKCAFISRYDLARATAAVLLGKNHRKKVFHLTGSKAISFKSIAKIYSNVTGKDLPFVTVSEKEFGDILKKDSPHLDDHFLEIVNSLYRAVEAGEFASVSSTVENLTGRPAETFEHYVMRKWKKLNRN